MRVLFDHNVPRGLRSGLPLHDIVTTNERGWAKLTNGKLLDAAEAAGFEVMVTGDQSLVHQQNLTKRKLALVILGTNLWPVIRLHIGEVAAAIDAASPGTVTSVSFPLPPLRRRAPPGNST
jgi:hypothetical protein